MKLIQKGTPVLSALKENVGVVRPVLSKKWGKRSVGLKSMPPVNEIRRYSLDFRGFKELCRESKFIYIVSWIYNNVHL